ncbi:Lrp/AsnC family transcriptional regulator [Haloquadratum walsbyi]|jgi:Transcriptional regulators|uniref:Transcriptional regulator n=1 Tax=Haloquadratum walsbyi J07HQW2 TaxID=1238425 RepID=U1NIQ1_9EURY|nr:Lrp/AsnC family transcriptional regulator [Haloquadratum walsbyi]ERG97100.1 MAG: transcriptional regulator [Haloquadratum walsbyi J07HQW2]
MIDRTKTFDNLDGTDLEILEMIEADFDVSLETVAQKLDLSKSAVHYRVKKLKENGIIRGVTADVDPLALGLEMVAITDVSVSHEEGYSEDIGKKLMTVSGVGEVYYTMGDIDFVAISRVQTRDQLNDLIERIVAIDGINETSSKFVMEEFHDNQNVSGNLTQVGRELILDS